MKTKYEFKHELKYYAFVLALIFIGGVFLKALEPDEHTIAYAKCIPDEPLFVCDYRAASVIATTTTNTPEVQRELPAFKDKYEEMIFKVFGEEDYQMAYAIAKAESSLKPDRCHIDEKEYSCGLMQINLRAHGDKVPGETFEEKAEWLKDPQNNFTMTRVIKANSKSWNPWTMFTNGMYEQYLD